MKIQVKTPASSEWKSLPEDDRRLFLAAFAVLLFCSLTVAHLLTKNMLWKVLGSEPLVDIVPPAEQEKIYEVLLEQEFADEKVKDEYKALSDKNSTGRGGLTKEKGFHTLSNFREFVWGSMFPSTVSKPVQKREQQTKDEETYEVGILKQDPVSYSPSQNSPMSTPSPSSRMTKIPANYRFKQDFLFRWDGYGALSMPTKKLAGYQYFKHMLNKIENRFAPPGGGNYAYRDAAGTVVSQGILPGQAKVLFKLAEDGRVLDVQLVSGQGQPIVGQACVDSIRGQNFGKVPPEVIQQSHGDLIFGINFIFPDRY